MKVRSVKTRYVDSSVFEKDVICIDGFARFDEAVAHLNDKPLSLNGDCGEGFQITKEEKKIPNQKFGRYFNQLTGKNYQELKPFYEKVKKELDKLK